MKSSIFTQFSFSMMQSLRTIENHFSDENFCLIFIFSIPFQKALFSHFLPFFADYTNKINWVNPDPVKKWLLLFVCLFVCLSVWVRRWNKRNFCFFCSLFHWSVLYLVVGQISFIFFWSKEVRRNVWITRQIFSPKWSFFLSYLLYKTNSILRKCVDFMSQCYDKRSRSISRLSFYQCDL